jgi:hypothetical protein
MADLPDNQAHRLLRDYGLEIVEHPAGAKLPGSYWGDGEAGLVADGGRVEVHVRPDTPVHSLLHESCHALCMDGTRRRALHTEAGGDDDEESAVCYLQILLADELPAVGSERLMQDMDAWGYSFRLGSTRAWFEEDAADARRWLVDHGLLTDAGRLTGRARQ